MMHIYFDNNVLVNLVHAAVDPVSALAGSKYVIAVTPDLAAEYRQAATIERVSSNEKNLCQRLLKAATQRGIFGFAEGGPSYSGFSHGVMATANMVETIQFTPIAERPGKDIPKNRTDAFLAALAQGAIIITNDNGPHFNRAREAGRHVYSWTQIANFDKAPSDVARELSCLLMRASS